MMMKKTGVCSSIMCSALALTISTSYVQAQHTQVNLTSIKSGKGKIILNVFKDNQTYEQQLPYKRFVFDKKGLNAGAMSVSFEIEPGTYGITLLDDENDNGKMDMNLIKIPKEGFGFSNFFMEKLKRPTFNDFKVELKSGTNKVAIKVKYL